MVAHRQKVFPPYRGDVAVVQPLNHIWVFAILWTAARLASQSLTISQSPPKFTESVTPPREGGDGKALLRGNIGTHCQEEK